MYRNGTGSVLCGSIEIFKSESLHVSRRVKIIEIFRRPIRNLYMFKDFSLHFLIRIGGVSAGAAKKIFNLPIRPNSNRGLSMGSTIFTHGQRRKNVVI